MAQHASVRPPAARLALALAACLFAPGCGPGARAGGGGTGPAGGGTVPQPATLSNTDPCATRLHDLAGHLLLYYAANNALPATLDDLAVAFALSSEDVICPVSRRPYGYDPNGVIDRITENVLVVFDPVPAHAGLRWAVAVGPPNGGPLVTKIVAVSEGNVVWPPAAEPRR